MASLLVVGDDGSLNSADQAVQSLLQGLGETVTVVDDQASAPSSGTYDLIVICESVNSGNVGSRYNSITDGIVNFEQALSDDLGLADTVDENTDLTAIQIVDDTHPIADGFSNGSLTVLSSADEFFFLESGDLQTGVGVVAEDGDGNPLLIYGDSPDFSGRRVHLGFAGPDPITDFNANGDALLENMFTWAGGLSAGTAFDETGLAISATATVAATDTQAMTESALVEAESTVVASDQLAATDSAEVAITATVTGTDAFATAESLSITVTSTVTGSDGLAYTESLAVSAEATIESSDTLAATESRSIAITATVTGDDTLAATDSLTVDIESTVTATDVLSGAHIETGLGIVVTSTVTGTDTLAAAESLSVAIVSTVTGTDVQPAHHPQGPADAPLVVAGAGAATGATAALAAVLSDDGKAQADTAASAGSAGGNTGEGGV